MNKTAQVDISFINPAKPGKKMGSIKTRDNTLYWVYSDKLSQFSTGPCTIEYNDDPGKDGKVFLKALGVVGSNGAGAATPAVVNSAPRGPSWENRVGTPHSGGEDRSRIIFICGIVNNAVRAGKVDPSSATSIGEAVRAAGAAYDATMGRE